MGRYNFNTDIIKISSDAVYFPEKLLSKKRMFNSFKKTFDISCNHVGINEFMKYTLEERFFFILNHELHHSIYYYKYMKSAISVMVSMFLVGLITCIIAIPLNVFNYQIYFFFIYPLFGMLFCIQKQIQCEREANSSAKENIGRIDPRLLKAMGYKMN